MKQSSILVPVLVAALFLTGCVAMYKPNVINSPLLKTQGDGRVTGSLGLIGDGLNNLQASYALTDNVGLMANAMLHAQGSENEDEDELRTTFKHLEGGAGLFRTFGLEKKGVLQVFGGGGMGTSLNVMMYQNAPRPRIDGRFFNAFVQPGVGFCGDYFEAALDTRFNYVQLYNIKSFQPEQFPYWQDENIARPDTTLRFMNLEPAVTLRFGSKRIKATIQLGLVLPLWNAQTYANVSNTSILLTQFMKCSFGLSYTFGLAR